MPLKVKSHSVYEALGLALANWQHVETALFFIVHCALGTSDDKSSTVFFHLRSPSAKAKIANELLQRCFETDYLKEHWKPLARALSDATDARNHLAHYEIQNLAHWDKDNNQLVRLEPVLTEPFHDISTHDKTLVKSYDKAALDRTSDEFRRVARELLAFSQQHFSPDKWPQKFGEKALENLLGMGRSTRGWRVL